MASLNQNPTPVKAETTALDPDVAADLDSATIALFRAVWGPAGTPEAQEAALALHDALAAQEDRLTAQEGPSAADLEFDPPDAQSQDWWAVETREDGESWLAGDMTNTERLTIPAADYHGLFDLPPAHGPADGADSDSGSDPGADREISEAEWDRLVDRLALERGWAVD
jgi:hypothetical protein